MESISCDLDLQLRLGCRRDGHQITESTTATSTRVVEFFERSKEEQQQQQITIFYNGEVCVCDATEIKARAIISMAKLGVKRTQVQQQTLKDSSLPQNLLPSPHCPEKLMIKPELPMKRSLQRFLQNRKSRLDSLSPYTKRIRCPL